MCNAWNHPIDCDCGFGGDTGGGGGGYGGITVGSNYLIGLAPFSKGWAADGLRTIESYTNPNAHCPVCGAAVFFYQSPYGGRVFFDDLGPPWPKHPCTDNHRTPTRVTRFSASHMDVGPRARREQGWQPLLYSKVYKHGGSTVLTGDLGSHFAELKLLEDHSVDRNGPVIVRPHPTLTGFHQVSFLESDHFSIRERLSPAVENWLVNWPRDILKRVLADDPTALLQLGQHVLYILGKPNLARGFLRRAWALGSHEALFDLAVTFCFAD